LQLLFNCNVLVFLFPLGFFLTGPDAFVGSMDELGRQARRVARPTSSRRSISTSFQDFVRICVMCCRTSWAALQVFLMTSSYMYFIGIFYFEFVADKFNTLYTEWYRSHTVMAKESETRYRGAAGAVAMLLLNRTEVD
jgi:hypothetical protein